MGKFNMNDLLNDKSKTKDNTSAFKIKHIHISKLIPNEKNFYAVDDVTELKESILMFGLQQNLVVREIVVSDTYTVTSGHRRLKALGQLVEEGHEEYELVPCKVVNEIDEIKSELQLIFANSTSRELSDYEKTHQVIRMKELLIALKKSGIKLTGRLREMVADTLKVSTTQVARMESIDNNLSTEFKEEFKNNKVNFSTAYELSGLKKEEQTEVYQEFKSKGNVTINDVKSHKAKQTNEKAESPKTKTKPSNQKTEPRPEEEKKELKEEATKPFEQLKVYVCSPYGGKQENYHRAIEHCKYVASHGHIPFASHVMLHGIFDDTKEEDRKKGLFAGLEMVKAADVVWVFGEKVTSGMRGEIEMAQKIGKRILNIDDKVSI